VSLTGPDIYATGSSQNQHGLDAMLAHLGKAVSDLTVVEARDPTGDALFLVSADDPALVSNAFPSCPLPDSGSSPGVRCGEWWRGRWPACWFPEDAR
jgi:hypothetical protein